MTDEKQKTSAVRLGRHVSALTSNLFAHPYMQVFVIAFCADCFVLGLNTDVLTAALSILAITDHGAAQTGTLGAPVRYR